MSIPFILFIVIHIAAFVFLFESLRRIRKRSNEYQLRETEETLPLGIVRLRHLVILYVIVYFIWAVASVWFYSIFVDNILF